MNWEIVGIVLVGLCLVVGFGGIAWLMLTTPDVPMRNLKGPVPILTREAYILVALSEIGNEVEREVFPPTAREVEYERIYRFWKGEHYAR